MSSKIRNTEAEGAFQEDSLRANFLLQVRLIYISFTQGLFAAAPPGSYRWTPQVEQTEIIITDENPIQTESVGKRPAITFTRGPVQSYSLGQDDLMHYDFQTGAKKKSILIPGTMSINCCSRVDIESESLAAFVADQLWMHRELLMRRGFFEIGRQYVIGAPSPAGSIVAGDSADEWYVTTVTSPFQIYRTSSYTPLNQQIVDQIGVNYELNARRYNGLGPVLSPAEPNLPYNVQSNVPGQPTHLVPHPLNPTQMVVLKAAHPNRVGLRRPTIGGRTIPFQQSGVEESVTSVPVVKTAFKV